MPWVILNQQYFLLFIEQKVCIVDAVALQKNWVFSQLEQATLPLVSRPLLVPVPYSFPLEFKSRVETLVPRLAVLGIRIDYSKEETWLIRSIPVNIPYLDLPVFFDALTKLQSFEMQDLFPLISLSQSFNPEFFSAEEREELNHWLLNDQDQEGQSLGIYKILSMEDYKALLHG